MSIKEIRNNLEIQGSTRTFYNVEEERAVIEVEEGKIFLEENRGMINVKIESKKLSMGGRFEEVDEMECFVHDILQVE